MRGHGHGKKTQAFHLRAPTAASVQLVGDFTHWLGSPINLTRGDEGVWSASVPLPRGAHPYRFLVDGEWADDPECSVRVPNPFGTENAVRNVP